MSHYNKILGNLTHVKRKLTTLQVLGKYLDIFSQSELELTVAEITSSYTQYTGRASIYLGTYNRLINTLPLDGDFKYRYIATLYSPTTHNYLNLGIDTVTLHELINLEFLTNRDSILANIKEVDPLWLHSKGGKKVLQVLAT